jgi:hypothetical protein
MPASPIQVRVLGPHLHLFGPVFEPRAPPDASPQKQDRGAGARSRTVLVSETTLAIELPGNDDLVVRRTTTQAVRSIKGQRPRTANPTVS